MCDHTFKIILIGDLGVGKTCLLGRYATNRFYDNFCSTIGVDFQTRTIVIDDKKIKLVLWDTAGQERFSNVTSSYFRGAHGIIMVYDICNRVSFQEIANKWLRLADRFGERTVVRVLAGTKMDRESDREVPFKEAEKFAREREFTFFETSALANVNVDELLMRTAHEILVTLFVDGLPKGISINKSDNKNRNQSGCCMGETYTNNSSCDVHQDYTSPVNDFSVAYPEEKDLNATDWRKNMEELYKKNKSLFESYRIRAGWFISYKQDDYSDVLAERLYRDLEGDNWFDMYYNKTRTRAAMIKGILRRDKFICFLSPAYLKSQWCVMELTTAFCSGKTIVPVFNQDRNTAGSLLNLVPDCFDMLRNEDFIGLFADTGPYRGQLKKVVGAGGENLKDEFYDSEKESDAAVL